MTRQKQRAKWTRTEKLNLAAAIAYGLSGATLVASDHPILASLFLLSATMMTAALVISRVRAHRDARALTWEATG